MDWVAEERGDSAIPADGVEFRHRAAIEITPIQDHRVSISYSQSAAILRGIWELTAASESCTLAITISIGKDGPVGRAVVFNGTIAANVAGGSQNTAR